MIIIRTAEEMTRALKAQLDPELNQVLNAHWERLTEYDDLSLEDIACFLIVQEGETLGQVEAAYGQPLLANGDFVWLPELIEQHGRWLEVTFILSDDGFGLVLLLEVGQLTDQDLLTACRRHLQHIEGPSAE